MEVEQTLQKTYYNYAVYGRTYGGRGQNFVFFRTMKKEKRKRHHFLKAFTLLWELLGIQTFVSVMEERRKG